VSLYKGGLVLSHAKVLSGGFAVPVLPVVTPALEHFLSVLSQDIDVHPECLQRLDSELVQRIQALVDGVDVDLAVELSAEDE